MLLPNISTHTSLTITPYKHTDSIVATVFDGQNHTLDGIERRLEILEQVLGVPKYDTAMISKYPNLKKLYDEMIVAMSVSNLHAAQYLNELAKYRTWDSLNT